MVLGQEKMSTNSFYLTTTLPYVNAEPHIGFALEILAADAICRFQRLQGKEVIFNTGTDEHGQKIYQKALEAGIDPQTYCDQYAAKFAELKTLLNLSYTHFIRTTDSHHIAAAQEFWNRCQANGDIYKKLYQIKYCVGCELEKTDSELVDGRCPLHPNQELQQIEEENYFFKFSKYQQALLDLYDKNPEFVKPAGKLSEIKSFVAQGLQDFSVSRLKTKMPWGIPVPNDNDHVMYVWFDALVNYISTLGWPEGQEFKDFWPGMQVAGKDNLRQQSAMWQAMLLSAGVTNSKQILINGFISVDGQKMSKSLGNVISPTQLVERYGQEATRFLLLNLGPFNEDMDVSWAKFDTTYTAELANSLGNACSRIAKLCEKAGFDSTQTAPDMSQDITESLNAFQVGQGLQSIKVKLSSLDEYLSQTTPWKKEGSELQTILEKAVSLLLQVLVDLQPFMPQTSEQLINHFTQSKITSLSPLFPRLPDTN